MPKANARKARSAGELDQTFAHSGLQTLQFPAARKTIGKSVAVLPSGHIMVSTTVIDASGASHYGLTRLLADGHLDTSFGEGGYLHGQFVRGDCHKAGTWPSSRAAYSGCAQCLQMQQASLSKSSLDSNRTVRSIPSLVMDRLATESCRRVFPC